jgi:hypothetical protein
MTNEFRNRTNARQDKLKVTACLAIVAVVILVAVTFAVTIENAQAQSTDLRDTRRDDPRPPCDPGTN